jgi:hypothetical protein
MTSTRQTHLKFLIWFIIGVIILILPWLVLAYN